MTTHQVVKDAITNMQEMMRVVDSLLRLDVKGSGQADPDLVEHRKRWQGSLDLLIAKEKEIRPHAGMKQWEAGQKEASKNYNPGTGGFDARTGKKIK